MYTYSIDGVYIFFYFKKILGGFILKNLMKNWLIVSLLALAFAVLAACGTDTNSNEGSTSNNSSDSSKSSDSSSDGSTFAEMTIKFGHTSETTEPTHIAALQFAEKVSERTDGAVTVNVFPAEQVGNERDMIEQTKSGALELVFASPGSLGVFNPDIEIFNGPFLWDDWEQAKKVMRGPLGEDVYGDLEADHGLTVLDPSWYWGWRHITANKEIRKPEDMKGLKFRVPEQPIWLEMAKAMGANPTPIAFSEVYTALQQGVVDAQENPIPTILAKNFYEVQDYVILSGHMLQSNHVVANTGWYNDLSPELQEIIFEEIRAAGEIATKLQMEAEESNVAEIKAAGVKFIEDVDRKAFEVATSITYEVLAENWSADLYDRVQEAKKQ